jgi:hypothetical protein
MAAGDFIDFGIWDASNAPKTDALANGLQFTAYRNRAGTARAQPTITHLGNGVYRFQPSTSDVAEGIAYAVQTGTGAFPARYSGAICPEAAPFAAFLLTAQADGSLWTGAVPTVGMYVDPSGNARTPPALAAVAGAYLYTLTPSSADLAVGVAYRLSLPSGADPAPPVPGSFAVPTTVDPAIASNPQPQGLFNQTITYAAVSGRDVYGKPTMGAPSTAYARIQPTRDFVWDQAREKLQANFIIYTLPSTAVGYQHRVWLPGDDLGSAIASRRILAIDDPVDGKGVKRFRRIYVM